jgi:ketosteroid isomerase-like protein
MYKRVVKRFVVRAYDRLNSHDVTAIGRLFAADATFTFPGMHSLSGQYVGREAIECFFASLFDHFPDLRFEVEDFTVSGPPWRMRLWVRYRDCADGRRSWSGTGTQYAHLRWGRLQHDYIANDTQAVAHYLAATAAG